MKLKMTIDEALEFADEWSAGQTFHEDSQGWRVVCMLLAKEVRGLQGERERCAKIVEDYNPGGSYHVRTMLAEAIRKETP